MNKREFIFNRIIGFIIISIMMVVYFYYGQINIAFGPSMTPTIISGERIFISKRSYDYVKPQINDVVFLRSPKNGMLLIKRVVAKEKDQVDQGDDGVRVNNKLLANSFGFGQKERIFLSFNQYFVLGDNRTNSDDSRDFGPVSNGNILGKVIFVIWPPAQWRVIK